MALIHGYNRLRISSGPGTVSLFALLAFLAPAPAAAGTISFQSKPVLLVGPGSFGADHPLFTVTGPDQFAAYENTGAFPVDFTIATAPGSLFAITMIAVRGGIPSDPDDLMAIVSAAIMPKGPFANGVITPMPLPANGTLILVFNPYDNSGMNDGDFGTTPFTVMLDYSGAFCTLPPPCGIGFPGNPITKQNGVVMFDIDGTTLDPGVPNPPGTFPVPTPEPGSFGYMFLGVATIPLAVIARQRS